MSSRTERRFIWYFLGTTCFLILSTRAVEWNVQRIPIDGTNAVTVLTGVAFGNGKFVAVSEKGEVFSATGTDPETWTRGEKIPDAAVHGIIFAEGKFAAVGFDTAATNALLLTSSDGVEWSRQRLLEHRGPVTEIAYGNGRYVVMGPEFLARSRNGIDWVQDYSFVRALRVYFKSIDFVRDEFMLTTVEEADSIVWPTILAVADDGEDWNLHGNWLPGFTHVAYGRKVYIGLGQNDCVPCGSIFISMDGRNWERSELPGNVNGLAIEYANGVFAIAGWGAPSAMLTSTNGTTWEEFKMANYDFVNSIAYGRGRFVAVGRGVIVVSDFVGGVPYISNARATTEGVEFEFNAEEKTEWQVEGSRDLVEWQVVQEIEGSADGRQAVTLRKGGDVTRFIRMREVR